MNATALPVPAAGAPRAAASHAAGASARKAAPAVDFAALLGVAVGFEAGEPPAEALPLVEDVDEVLALAQDPLEPEQAPTAAPPATPEALFDPNAFNAAALALAPAKAPAPPAGEPATDALLDAPGPKGKPIDGTDGKTEAPAAGKAAPEALAAPAADAAPRKGLLGDPGPKPERPAETPAPVPVPALKTGEPVAVAVPVPQPFHAALAATPMAQQAVAVPVGHPDFADAAADRVAFIARQGLERAELQVTPPDLGPVTVKISIDNRVADVVMVAASPETRSALEQSLPELASRLAENGLTLGQAHVGDGHGRAPEWAQDSAPRYAGADNVGDPGGSVDVAQSRIERVVKVGLVDDFA